jgi:hypothetical protein
MVKLSGNDPRVVAFFHHFHDRKSVFPSLYFNPVDNQTVNVILPVDLSDYSNAAAGRFAIGADGVIRPKGLRVKVSDAADFVDRIFSSTDRLADFISSSECDGIVAQGSAPQVRAKSLTVVTPVIDDRPVADAFYDRYTFSVVKDLKDRFGADTVIREWKILTMNEFELRYGLAA